jgi:toxin ParE1/3/4
VGQRCRVRLSEAAERDLDDIYLWTAEKFGVDQARAYRRVLLDALRALRDGPDIIGVKDRADLAPGLKSLHIARQGKRGRHFIMFDAALAGHIRVVRILHDAMDIARHVSGKSSEEGEE